MNNKNKEKLSHKFNWTNNNNKFLYIDILFIKGSG